MKNFYKIVDSKAQVGSGTVIHEGFTVYTIGDEPQELIDALAYKTLDEAKAIKKAEMLSKFDEVSIESVPVGNISYNGGFDSALKLDGAKRLVELAGGSEVTFYDIDNKPNVLSIADANTVILTISAKVQTDFGHLQDLKVLIDGKLKVSTVEAIVW